MPETHPGDMEAVAAAYFALRALPARFRTSGVRGVECFLAHEIRKSGRRDGREERAAPVLRLVRSEAEEKAS